MADEEASSKTEEPTQHKLQEARKKGDVAKTPDLPQLFSLAAVAGVILIGGGWLATDMTQRLLPFIAHPDAMDMSGNGGVGIAQQAIMAGMPALMAVMVAAALAGIAGNVVQHGLLFTTEKMKPDFKKVSPLEGFKRIFGPDGWVQFLKSALKIGVTGAVAWMVLKPHAHELQGLAAVDPAAMLPATMALAKALFFAVLCFLLVTAGGDWLWQRARFMKRMRMSREELKDEYKQSDGDPHVKAKRKQMQMEVSRRRMMQNVPNATVVVMNPTHYAVALRYVQGETAAPECVAKGVDELALRIRAVAEEAGVAIIEDPPLARALFATTEVDRQIPEAHYQAVARIIGFVMGQKAARATTLR
ncbi:MAG: flagellar biosynthesis protein FlhB [Caulobacteraceae bacterium]|nr:MAG: flagellar biosynthesis protein FlhB [Caulobacteraceae bacterium]